MERGKINNKIIIVFIYFVLLPGLLLFFSFLNSNAQTNGGIAVPIDTSSIGQVKSGTLSVGTSSGSMIAVGNVKNDGMVTLQKSSVDYAVIGFDPNQQYTPFWYSLAATNGRHVPFPLWSVNTTSSNIYTLNAIAIGSSTVWGPAALTVLSSASGVPISFYTGTSLNNAAIAVNAAVTSTAVGDETHWNWFDVNRDAEIASILFGNMNQSGIVLTIAQPYNIDPAAQQYSLRGRWKTVLQLGTNGDAVLGSTQVPGQFVFTAPTQTSSCNTAIDGTNFFVPEFLNWKENSGTIPLYVFPVSKVFTPGQHQCFMISGTAYDYTYMQYKPEIQGNVYVNAVHMVNPYDVSGWDTMSSADWQVLVSGLEQDRVYYYGDNSIRTPEYTQNNTIHSHDLGVLGPDRAGETRYIVPNDSKKTRDSFVWVGNMTYEVSSRGYDTWVLCPNGYFVNAFKWDTQDGASSDDHSYEPAIKCGRP